ncbi:CRISPR-associated endonuclease/helicase Cas3 [Amycolatopsis arida]|uniref:CRISPR-associated endonuclease/helicase Cas3 n=1 Tax=Amycolatopsis arida TaxID=587909 RepID=A0A1I5R1M8_9PSEU|nr:CRISPR-associated helicase/endonuclease Cas3 [Amycolatopsis arida]TDX99043.1 CRISPR-associated endonuclease/helicase Cas3 [Amycolatopsis arida]SFP52428.1 CRISPR-associated endonuclease/helicase Cas3 [Amycolatopsis arida]
MGDSLAWLSAWAKSVRSEQGEVTHWLPLSQHMEDSAAVARRLVEEWVPRQVVERIGRDLPGGARNVPVLASWLAGIHDVGKLSPAFAVQVPLLADRMRRFDLIADPRFQHERDRRQVTHSLVGHLAVRNWLTELGLPRRGIATQLASIVGSHHGVAPERDQLAKVREFSHLAGTGAWETARSDALAHVTGLIGGPNVLGRFRDATITPPSLVLLSGIVIVADWIASNADLFELEPITTAELPPRPPEATRTRQRLEWAWRELDLPPKWAPAPLGADLDAEFRARFPRISRPHPVQVAAVKSARNQHEPGILVIEAPMGVGKTEAALVAAEVLAQISGAGGCFVALPTRATSDAMFGRVAEWLRALRQIHSGAPIDVTLAHGKASLNDNYQGLVRARWLASIGDHVKNDHDDSIVVHQWLRGNKKGSLASFVVGTIDQVLLAGLKSRHLMLRHLALAGKVVVIDEVHAYDVYMSQYLHRVLHWLGAYRVPVVLLSATLPAARRADLLRAYSTGRGEQVSEPRGGITYPAISSSADPTPHAVPDDTPPKPVGVDRLPDDLDSLVAYLKHHLADGGCAVVVRNTVRRVQETADRLAEEFGSEKTTVNHSRFLACDRARLDAELVRRFGPPGPDNDRKGPHIVVASQVVEQSLDVDFDLMVTDLAPIDLVLQRLGRLHRHPRDRPTPLRQPRCAIVGVEDWHAEPIRAIPRSRRVYSEHPLLRAAALLAGRSTITLPDDIAPLVQRAYGGDPLGPPSWQPALLAAARLAEADAARRRERASAFLLDEPGEGASLIGWLRAGVGDADGPRGAAQVRDGTEPLEVLVVRRDRDGGVLTPDWIERSPDRQIPLDQPMPPALAKVIAACALRLPLALSHEGVIDDVIKELERHYFTSFATSPLLAGHLVLPLDDDRRATLRAGGDEFLLTYDPRRGLIHDRR